VGSSSKSAPKSESRSEIDEADALTRRWGKVVSSLRTAELRAAWLRDALRSLPAGTAALALDRLCLSAEEGVGRSEVVLHALIELMADPTLSPARETLRGEARSKKLLALERLLRRPFSASGKRGDAPAPRPADAGDDDSIALASDQEQPERRDVPDYGRGRTLTLGERKSLARRPPPHLLPKVLADPHPDVIRNVLASARLTEDDVVRLATKRPNRPEVLQEVARHPRWCHRPRVRIALVLNPATPTELAISLVMLLLRHELPVVIETSALHPAVRAAAHERLERLPPLRRTPDGSVQ